MRTFIAFVSLIFLIVAMIFCWLVGGWRLFVGVLLLVLAIHLEIGLRCDEMWQDIARMLRDSING